MQPTKPIIRVTRIAACVAMLGLASCAADDYTQPIPDRSITPQEVREGDQAVQGIGEGGADPAIDNGQANDDTDGNVATMAPAQPEPSATQTAADERMVASDPESSRDQVEATRLTTSSEAEAPAQTVSPDRGTGTSVAELRPCRNATGYTNGHAFTICVTEVDGKLVGVQTGNAFVRMRAAAARSGVHITVVSGFRTMDQQRYLYDLYLHHHGNLAARPGYSNHQSGLALDLNTSGSGVYSWLARHGRSFGFVRTVPSEAWHWEHRY